MAVTRQLQLSARSAQPRRLVRSSDGDTTVIDQPIRMVSCDTPEKSGYAGKPQISQPKLDTCRPPAPPGRVSQLHIDAGEHASEAFSKLLATRLTRPNGTTRSVA